MEGEAQEYKAMEFKEEEEGEVTAPVSPTGQYFNSSVLSICILAVLESEVPIDDSLTMTLLKDVFLPINPRFSSIMVFIALCPKILLSSQNCGILVS